MGRDRSPSRDRKGHSLSVGSSSGSTLTRTLLVLLVLVLSMHLLIRLQDEDVLSRLRTPAQTPMHGGAQFAALTSDSQDPSASAVTPPTGPPRLATYTVPPGVLPLSELRADTARTMVVAFASLNTFPELYEFWPPFEQFFLKPHQEEFKMGLNLNFSLVYEVFPQDTRKELDKWISAMKLSHVSGSRTENHGLQVYRSPGGVLIHLQPLAINLPEYIAADISLTHRLDWMRCGRNKTFPFPYVFYNTVFTHAIARHPLLEGYDFYQKIDTDIIFKATSPHSLFGTIADKQCLFSHANIVQAWPNCQWRANAALAEFTRTRHLQANSIDYGWCSDESLYFYGNFVVVYLGLMRSRENLDFLDFLYNDWTEGYFKHRWTDQAVWPKIMCLFAHIPEVKDDKQICDFSHWRHNIFKHV